MFIQESEEIDELKSNTSTTSSGSEFQPIKKTCSDCGTNRTPLWRGGPAGPKSLCNACGIRSRKRRRALLGLTNPEVKMSRRANKSKKVTIPATSRDDGSNCSSTSEISGDEGMTWHRSTAGNKRRGGVLGEEEQAAVLLMAMAYSSVLV